MYSTISLPRFKEITMKEAVECEGNYRLFVETERKPHRCPIRGCGRMTERIYDYRVQKIQHRGSLPDLR